MSSGSGDHRHTKQNEDQLKVDRLKCLLLNSLNIQALLLVTPLRSWSVSPSFAISFHPTLSLHFTFIFRLCVKKRNENNQRVPSFNERCMLKYCNFRFSPC